MRRGTKIRANADDTIAHLPDPDDEPVNVVRPCSAGKATRSARRKATALVVGSNEVGSAIARALHLAGWCVVLIDGVDPSCPWRGMSYVNAWYFGTAELDGVGACFCSSVKSIPSVIDHERMIAATTWSWQGVAAALSPDMLIDARTANGGSPDPLLRQAPSELITMGCGPGFVAPDHVDVAVDTSYGEAAGRAVTRGAVSSALGDPQPLAGVGVQRFVVAPRSGRFQTPFSLRDRVVAGDAIGEVHGAGIRAPTSGILRGLSARGAFITEGQVVVEVDVRADPALCDGVDPRAARIADGVVDAATRLGLTAVVRRRNPAASKTQGDKLTARV